MIQQHKKLNLNIKLPPRSKTFIDQPLSHSITTRTSTRSQISKINSLKDSKNILTRKSTCLNSSRKLLKAKTKKYVIASLKLTQKQLDAKVQEFFYEQKQCIKFKVRKDSMIDAAIYNIIGAFPCNVPVKHIDENLYLVGDKIKQMTF